MNYLLNLPKTYIDKKDDVFILRVVNTLAHCNRRVMVYELKYNHYYAPLRKLFRKGDKIVKTIVIFNNDELGLKGIKNRFFFSWFCRKYKIHSLPLNGI